MDLGRCVWGTSNQTKAGSDTSVPPPGLYSKNVCMYSPQQTCRSGCACAPGAYGQSLGTNEPGGGRLVGGLKAKPYTGVVGMCKCGLVGWWAARWRGGWAAGCRDGRVDPRRGGGAGRRIGGRQGGRLIGLGAGRLVG